MLLAQPPGLRLHCASPCCQRANFSLAVTRLPRDSSSQSSSPRGPDDAAHRIAPLQRAAANASDIPCRPLLASAVTDAPMRRRPTAGGMHSRELRRQGHGFYGRPPKKPKIKKPPPLRGDKGAARGRSPTPKNQSSKVKVQSRCRSTASHQPPHSTAET